MFEHFNMHLLWIVSICCAMNYSTAYLTDQVNFNRIINTDMFDDLVMNGSTVGKNVFLAYDNEDCKDALWNYGVNEYKLPPPQHALYLKYDTIESPKHVWYTEKEVLADRYPVKACPTMYFIKKGSTKTQKAVQWNYINNTNFAKWAWGEMRARITLKNSCPFLLKIDVESDGPYDEMEYNLKPGEEKVITAYPSDIIMAHTVERDFINGLVVYGSTKVVFKNDTRSNETQLEWLGRVLAEERANATLIKDWAWSASVRNLLNLKQPLLLPNLTADGYTKSKTPPEAQQMLLNHLATFSERRTDEYHLPSTDSIINSEVKRSTIVDLNHDPTLKDRLNAVIQPYVEKWCNCRLESTFIYGIREFQHGHVLRRHVHRGQTHAISAMFVVQRDLAGAHNWPMEIIRYDGSRRNIYLSEGDMIMYEAAKLIHGNPTPFMGKSFSVAYIHYVPVDPEWTFRQEGNVLFDERRGVQEDVLQEFSPLMSSNSMFLTNRDEL